MKTIVPSYYHSFKCLADTCKNSCCIGWEIDIDEVSLERFKHIPGDFGLRLKDNIDFNSSPACFKLDEKEHCPFLNESGLCDIILTLGEDSICNICTDHPRFRNFFSDRTEIGLGLCCEACADIILSCKEKVYLVSDEDSSSEETEYEQFFLAFRDKIFDLLQDRSRTIDERVNSMLSVCCSHLPDKTIDEWADIFLKLEQLNPEWGNLLNKLRHADASEFNFSLSDEITTAFEQFLVYLAYRHLWDAYENDNINKALAFMALSFKMISSLAALKENCSMEYLSDICRIYSCEIEYSEDNMEILFDLL